MPFIILDGVRLQWTLEGPADRPTLFLLHPDDADPAMWDEAASALMAQFRVLRADLWSPGAPWARGGSDAPDNMAAKAEAAFAIMDATGIKALGLAAAGTAGALAAEMALRAPERVMALALICPRAPRPHVDGASAETLSRRLATMTRATLIILGRTDAAAPFETDGALYANAITSARTILMDCGPSPSTEAPEALAEQLQHFFLKPPTVQEAEARLYEVGLENRRRVLGDAYVSGALARRTPFNAEFQEMITRIAWHEIYSRPGLDLRTRRLVVLAVTAATARWEEFRLHLRAAITEGEVPRDEIKELLMQLAIYAGVPAANTGFAEAAKVFAELEPGR